MNNTELIPLLGMTLAELSEVALATGMPKFAAKQMAEWIYQKRVKRIDEMTNISMKKREQLSASYCVGTSEPIKVQTSVDGTKKYLFHTHAGAIETVMIPDRERMTLCVSSQVGCKMNCLFCATGKLGFHGHMTPCEILNQIFSVEEADQLTSFVFMGMGEPMDNLDAVLKATSIMTAPWGLAMSPRRITVSTIGMLAAVRRFVGESECHLAISLHATTHEQRLRLMPIEKASPFADIVDELRLADWAHQRRLTFEYIMFHDQNDSDEDAGRIARLLKGLYCRVNLISFHSIEEVDLRGSSPDRMLHFRDKLNSLGVIATVRASRGEDIFAACGLLAAKS